MVAYTALQYPWTIRPLSPELKIALSSLDPLAGLPLAPKGFRMDGFLEMFNMFTSTHQEHDPERDFRAYSLPDAQVIEGPDYHSRSNGYTCTPRIPEARTWKLAH